MAKAQQEPTINSKTDEVPPSTFGGKLRQYAFTEKSTASPKRPITRSCSTLQPTPPKASPLIPNHLTPPKTPSQAPSPTKRKPSDISSPTRPKKRKRPSSTYAPPTTYLHHPNLLTDTLAPHLLILFIGCNPGLRTASTGHAYAHPSNLFYKLLHASHITPHLHHPSSSPSFPTLYNLGLTNIVQRVTRDASELCKEEMDAGVGVLEEKCRVWRPEVVCLVGKGVWESVWRVRHGGRGFGRGEMRYGWQGEGERMGKEEGEGGWGGSRVFVATTTSGLAAGMGWGEKLEVWRELGEWVGRRRGERAVEGGIIGGNGEGDNDRGVGKGGVDGGDEEAVE